MTCISPKKSSDLELPKIPYKSFKAKIFESQALLDSQISENLTLTDTNLPFLTENREKIPAPHSSDTCDSALSFQSDSHDVVYNDNHTPTLKIFTPPCLSSSKYLLPPSKINKPCLVVDLDETLIHSTFIPFNSSRLNNFSFSLEISGEEQQVYVYCRPYLKNFLNYIKEHYECVLFTASNEWYADIVLDHIDPENVFSHRLFRESCSISQMGVIKNLNYLGRDLKKTLIIDNTPLSYMLNTENAIPIYTWTDDENDKELLNIINILEYLRLENAMPNSLVNLAFEYSEDQQSS